MAKKHMKMLNISSHKGNANQSTLRFHLTPVRIAIIKNTNNRCWGGCREKGTLYTLLVRMQASAIILEKNLEAS
jgi:hypothetical protein